ncbi:Predicted Zn-dependent peptidase [Lishizhenia tianjinensis]|uniref:Predicted Zn-dependent peptidase n=1 Tax=Lishizhenia tianjinensis TaxID=477690 RepID=A0A1I6YII2_9FLAO|nr:pitrilysin family protein [Lishizhenia tianjinensis]SFT50339.1 Predicted Zn-dependent peptidase [Lishizhenia tianjinensis]
MKKIILSLAVLGSMYSFGQLDRSVQPKAGEAPQINIAEPATFELSNGIKVIVSENHRQPKVAFNLVMGGDPILEGPKAGVSDFVSEMIMSGTSNRTKDQIDAEKDFIGAYLSASSSSVYLSCLTKHMDKGLELMLDITMNANFPESEFERNKKLFESGLLSAKSSPGEMASNAERKALFPNNNPYGEIMTEESLKSITRNDVLAYFNMSFTPQDAYLVIVGDITVEEAKEMAEAKFGSWKGEAAHKAEFNKGYFPKGNRVIFVEKPGAVQSVITIAHPIEMMPGNPDQIKLSVMNKILGGGGFGTRLMQNLREDKAYTYGAYSNLSVDRYGSYISASGNFRNDVTDSAIVQFLHEFTNITEGEVTDEELELNKMSMSGSFARSLESPQTIARFALNTYRNNLPADYYQTYLKNLMAVSKADVLEVAKKYITPNNLNIIVVGSPDVLDKLKKFDADGKIEMFDAFGNVSKKVEYTAVNMTASDILGNALKAFTSTASVEEAQAKIAGVKTYAMTGEASMSGAPFALAIKEYMAEGKKYYSSLSIPAMGMDVQKEVFTAEKGMTSGMGQAGPVTTEMTADELAEKHANFNIVGLDYLDLLNGEGVKVLGALEEDGKKLIVVQYTSEGNQKTAYFNAETFLIEKSVVMVELPDGSQAEMLNTFNDYTAVDGFMFSTSRKQVMGPQAVTFSNIVITLNEKLDEGLFKF